MTVAGRGAGRAGADDADEPAARRAAGELFARLDAQLARCEAQDDGAAREAARALLRAALDLHAAGLARLLAIARGAARSEGDPDGARLDAALAADPLVANVLLLHAAHPHPLERRAREAVERAAGRVPGAHASLAALSDDGTTARVAIVAPPPARAVLRAAVEDAVCAAAPELARVEFVELAAPSARAAGVDGAAAVGFVPLERLVRGGAAPRAVARAERDAAAAGERCALCRAPLDAGDAHAHLYDPARRAVLCACGACALLFDRPRADVAAAAAAAPAGMRRIASRAAPLADFRATDAQWDALGVPIGVAYFTVRSDGAVTAAFPGPAGATEAEVPREAWRALAADNPVLAALEPDTDALLAYRVGARRAHYRASLDVCLRLAGLVRARWSGLTGGAEVWRAIDGFFDALDRGADSHDARRAAASEGGGARA